MIYIILTYFRKVAIIFNKLLICIKVLKTLLTKWKLCFIIKPDKRKGVEKMREDTPPAYCQNKLKEVSPMK